MNRIIRQFVFILIIYTSITGCANKKPLICDCCEKSFKEISDANNCIKQHPIDGTSYDNRLFLIAFVSKDVETQQNSSWNIINDKDIVIEAMKDYLLIILDANDLSQFKEKNAKELIETINRHKNESLFFVVTNQELYPFRDWKIDENNELIIDRLKLGNGP